MRNLIFAYFTKKTQNSDQDIKNELQNIFKKAFFFFKISTTSTRFTEKSHRVAVTLFDHTGPG